MTRPGVVVGALEVARLGWRPMHEACVTETVAGLRCDQAQVREPRVDHPRLGREGQVSGGELLESPLRALVRSGADLEDQRLTALAREGREVVVQVRQELEVDEEFDGR